MTQVIVDGEDVVFEGDIPKETAQVYQLLMEALSEQAKVIYTIEVDGEYPEGGELPVTYEKIVITSITHDELTMKLSIESINQMSETGKHLDAYQKNVLLEVKKISFGDTKTYSDIASKIQSLSLIHI